MSPLGVSQEHDLHNRMPSTSSLLQAPEALDIVYHKWNY